jgi:hypothetical protein
MKKIAKKITKKIMAAGLFGAMSLGFLTPSWAAVSPASLSIFPPVQFPADDFAVTGLRVSALWGKHRSVYGLDIGVLGNITEQNFVGLAVSGLANVTHGTTEILGLQLAGLTNYNTNKTNVYGLQVALGVNYNQAAATVNGFQLAIANLGTFTDIRGAQVGIYNRAKEVYGLQIGLVNVADDLHGLQIGLVNFNYKGTFVVSPILNAGF